MKPNTLMVDNPDNAKLNRQRVQVGETNAYYDQQSAKVAQWVLGEIIPRDIAYSERPHGTLKNILHTNSAREGVE